jgi:multicomponent K+:H+ antiporter subunit E
MNPIRPSGWRARLLPRPLLTVMLWVTWLALNQSVHPSQLLLGLLLALLCAAWIGPMPQAPSPITVVPDGAPRFAATTSLARATISIRLFVRVLRDIVTANVQVARLILGPQERLAPGFITVPLTVRDPRGIALLAAIITMTPGTVSAQLSVAGTQLQVHVLDLRNPDALIAEIHERYERPILELFA